LKAQPIIGGLLVVVGLLILYLLRDLLFKVIVVVLGVVGLLIGFAFIVGGLALVFWRRRAWYRIET
jgi:formate/nitrite transporter FocA (FNT family)